MSATNTTGQTHPDSQAPQANQIAGRELTATSNRPAWIDAPAPREREAVVNVFGPLTGRECNALMHALWMAGDVAMLNGDVELAQDLWEIADDASDLADPDTYGPEIIA